MLYLIILKKKSKILAESHLQIVNIRDIKTCRNRSDMDIFLSKPINLHGPSHRYGEWLGDWKQV